MNYFNNSFNKLDAIEWKLTPYQILSLGFASLILFGGLLLTLPIASSNGQSLPFIDALFTATSAVCVTGLTVVDTGTYFSLFGQLVIIFLIQCGGLGIMTMSTLMAILMRKKLLLKDRLIMQEALNQLTFSGIIRLVIYIVKITFFIEFIGGTFLAVRFYLDFGLQGIYYGYWHAISAFCNAGFDIIGANNNNLLPYVGDITVNLSITTLIILGGLGFGVFTDINVNRNLKKLSLHTKLVLITTAGLIFFGTLSIFLLEYSNPATIAHMPFKDQFFASYFQAITARTAGFATINLGAMTHAAAFVIIILMFIGASPGSTGGGIKTTTFAIILASIWSQVRGNEETTIFYRTIPQLLIQRAFTIFFVFLLLVTCFTLLIDINEPAYTTSTVAFEVVSAFSTAGLTLGITPSLSSLSKFLLILAMFLGRVGPVTFALALVMRSKKKKLRYPEGKVSIG